MPTKERYQHELKEKKNAALPLIRSLNDAKKHPELGVVVSVLDDLRAMMELAKRENESASHAVYDPTLKRWVLQSPWEQLEKLKRRLPGKVKRLVQAADPWPAPMLSDDGKRFEWIWTGDSLFARLLPRIIVVSEMGQIGHVLRCENPKCGTWFYGTPNTKACDECKGVNWRVAKHRAGKKEKSGSKPKRSK